MATEKIDYATILADAEAKKAALDAYIASLRTALALGALGQPGDIQPGSFSSNSGPIDLPVGAFLGKSVPAAVKLYLSSIRKKQTTQQIAAALKEGGVESTASNFEQVVAGALFRLKQSGEVLRFPDGWGFAEHYPEHIRKAVSHENKPAPKKGKRGRPPKNKIAKKEPTAKSVSGEPKPIRTKTVIEKYFSAHPRVEMSVKEVAGALKLATNTVLLILAQMAQKGWLEKTADGKFRRPNKVTPISKAG